VLSDGQLRQTLAKDSDADDNNKSVRMRRAHFLVNNINLRMFFNRWTGI